MKTMIKDGICTGCGICTERCPEVFVFRMEKVRIKAVDVPQNCEAACCEAWTSCPPQAILIRR